ncbi:hypothetical protein FPSE_07997 [Fusarium pseudograminearum CS3096]|uniref:chitin synthase n=1 Tax=Fusarium pseudograminearum (strain CS3096) TaxID=1028729 RepID=K3VD05_FUSPC|nr:hypothetical protein FPSE_07997 [Fusarium pseudograminearum CS3096]EKJ71812.1 hypothetical protein FPSE_07997 [Fusarium pseudograminearum CS3096]
MAAQCRSGSKLAFSFHNFHPFCTSPFYTRSPTGGSATQYLRSSRGMVQMAIAHIESHHDIPHISGMQEIMAHPEQRKTLPQDAQPISIIRIPDAQEPDSEQISRVVKPGSDTETLQQPLEDKIGDRGLFVEDSGYPEVEDPVDPARILTRNDLIKQRTLFLGIILILNILLAIASILGNESKVAVAMVYFIKSKDFLSSIISPIGLVISNFYHVLRPVQKPTRQWILSLIPAYSESEEQIVKTIFSLRDNGTAPHRQVMVVILDGQPRNIRGNMTRVITQFERSYISFKWKRGTLRIIAGFMEDVPVIVLEKLKNSGKKDSLILCHDLFNYIRANAPIYTRLLRDELWMHVLPPLINDNFQGFDMIFCTDADSTIHKGALAMLANALANNQNAIAACGLVLVELEPGYEWSVWNLYQQFQYTFGQYVRRRAEHYIGKVTCLPGCITMISVREEMGGAIQKYAEPITGPFVLSHQVQYLRMDIGN